MGGMQDILLLSAHKWMLCIATWAGPAVSLCLSALPHASTLCCALKHTIRLCAVVLVQALLAGGTFNGELVIWDLSREDANAQVCQQAN
jgi:hypothetical protein